MLTTVISPLATTTTGLPQHWSSVITGLLILLSMMEILTATGKWNRDVNCSFYTAIIPLTLSFIGVVIFKATEVI